MKIDNPKADTVVTSGRTLSEIVRLMSEMRGILSIVDIPPDNLPRRVIYPYRDHFWAHEPDDQQWTMQGLSCMDVRTLKRGKGKSGIFNPIAGRLIDGNEVWKLYIAHDAQLSGDCRKFGIKITAGNLSEAIYRITYIVVPDKDISAHLDILERAISDVKRKLLNIGGWVTGNLRMLVVCRCGHAAKLDAATLFSALPEDRLTSDVVKRLRCTKCDSTDVLEVTALAPKEESSEGAAVGGYEPLMSSSRHGTHRNEIYEILGGDGTAPAYVGDGLYAHPDGKFEDF